MSVKDGIRNYLNSGDGEILNEDAFEFDFIIKENEEIAFITVTPAASGANFNESEKANRLSRDEFEKRMFDFFCARQDLPSCKVRYDHITVVPVTEEKCLIRYHRNIEF
jgi:Holliday junction resolvase-like predicted endonuclease